MRKIFQALLFSGSFSIESTMCTAGKSDEKRCNNQSVSKAHALVFIHKFNSCFSGRAYQKLSQSQAKTIRNIHRNNAKKSIFGAKHEETMSNPRS